MCFRNKDRFQLANFQSYFLNVGFGKGIVCYYKPDFSISFTTVYQNLQICKSVSKRLQLASVSMPESASISTFMLELEKIIERQSNHYSNMRF